MFEQSLIQEGDQTRKASSVLVSFLVQTVLLAVIVILPMIYYDSISAAALGSSLVAPPPPPPPPPPPAPVQVVKQVKVIPKQFNANVLMAPKQIPKEVAMIKEDELPVTTGVTGGVPGGLPGGVPGGVMGGLLGAIPGPPPPPPPKKEDPPPPKPPAAPIRVGGNVQSAKLIRQPRPVYPPLARQARISGTVKFNAIIAKDGTIQNLQMVSGHPLLVQAATEAVRQWVYQPTLLNGEPVEVITTIDVNFTLSQ
jgi:protein TonB